MIIGRCLLLCVALTAVVESASALQNSNGGGGKRVSNSDQDSGLTTNAHDTDETFYSVGTSEEAGSEDDTSRNEALFLEMFRDLDTQFEIVTYHQSFKRYFKEGLVEEKVKTKKVEYGATMENAREALDRKDFEACRKHCQAADKIIASFATILHDVLKPKTLKKKFKLVGDHAFDKVRRREIECINEVNLALKETNFIALKEFVKEVDTFWTSSLKAQKFHIHLELVKLLPELAKGIRSSLSRYQYVPENKGAKKRKANQARKNKNAKRKAKTIEQLPPQEWNEEGSDENLPPLKEDDLEGDGKLLKDDEDSDENLPPLKEDDLEGDGKLLKDDEGAVSRRQGAVSYHQTFKNEADDSDLLSDENSSPSVDTTEESGQDRLKKEYRDKLEDLSAQYQMLMNNQKLKIYFGKRPVQVEAKNKKYEEIMETSHAALSEGNFHTCASGTSEAEDLIASYAEIISEIAAENKVDEMAKEARESSKELQDILKDTNLNALKDFFRHIRKFWMDSLKDKKFHIHHELAKLMPELGEGMRSAVASFQNGYVPEGMGVKQGKAKQAKGAKRRWARKNRNAKRKVKRH